MASAKDLILISSSVLVIFAAGFAVGVLLGPQFETKPAVLSAPDLLGVPGVPDNQGNIGVASSGNLGVGTATADGPFHVAQAADGDSVLTLLENSQAPAVTSTNETVQLRFGFGGNNDVARVSVGKSGDYTYSDEEDSFMAFYTDLDGTTSEALRIDQEGNVGIGTTSPLERLHLYGGDGSASSNVGTGDSMLIIEDGQAAFIDLALPSASYGGLRFDIGGNSQGSVTYFGPTYSGSEPANSMIFRTDTVDRMTIDGDGNVGIGTTNPLGVLDVHGNLALTSAIPIIADEMTPDRSITYWDNLGGAESAKILFEQDTAPGHGNEPGEISFHTRPHDFDGGGVIQERMRILRNGNVGIGTPNPARLLHISNAMRLEPIERAPSSPSNGDLYYDNSGSHSLCIYINGSWSAIAGDGSCN